MLGDLRRPEACYTGAMAPGAVYFALAANGQELVARKLKTKQLPQLKPGLVKNLLKIRHPNLIKFEEFIILKVLFVLPI